MNRLETIAVFTAIDELCKNNNVSGIKRIAEEVLSEAKIKDNRKYEKYEKQEDDR